MDKNIANLNKINFQNLENKIEKSETQANQLWYNLIRLLITLSSSFLLITIALAKDIFHLNTNELPVYLVLS